MLAKKEEAGAEGGREGGRRGWKDDGFGMKRRTQKEETVPEPRDYYSVGRSLMISHQQDDSRVLDTREGNLRPPSGVDDGAEAGASQHKDRHHCHFLNFLPGAKHGDGRFVTLKLTGRITNQAPNKTALTLNPPVIDLRSRVLPPPSWVLLSRLFLVSLHPQLKLLQRNSSSSLIIQL